MSDRSVKFCLPHGTRPQTDCWREISKNSLFLYGENFIFDYIWFFRRCNYLSLLIWIQEYIERSLYTNYFLNFDRLTSYFHLKKYIYIYISSINTSWNIFLINNNNNNFSFNKSAIKLSFFLFYSKYLKIKYTRSLIIWSMIYIYIYIRFRKFRKCITFFGFEKSQGPTGISSSSPPERSWITD